MPKLAILSLKNRALIALITIAAAVFGGIALTNLKQELIPSIQFPGLIVVTSYPGASPDVVSTDVSTPIEQAVQGVPGIESSTATSSNNVSMVQLQFEYGTDLNTAEQKVSQSINRIKSDLPADADPQVLSISIDDLPVIQLAVSSDSLDEGELQSRLESIAVPRLEHLDGINAAEIVGGSSQRVTITPDAAKLAAAGYTPQSIKDALSQNGTLFPGGEITEGDETLTVQSGAKITSLDALQQLPLVPSAAGQQPGLTLDDVAEIELGTEPQTSISRVNGEDALSLSITKLPSANTVDVSHAVEGLIPELSDQLDGASISVVFDQAPFIEQSIESLTQEGLLGLVFAVLVILLFLMSVRSTLVTAISIPTSVLVTFVGLQVSGYSLNILTLGALTMAIGRVVDDAIVVIENIKRHYVGTADRMQSIVLAVREVAGAITASTLTTVAVFLPLAFVGDMTGELFRPFALTVTIAMLSSLLVALTIVPVLAYWFIKPGEPVLDADGNRIDPEDPAAPPSRLQRAYLPILRWTLKHSFSTLLIAVLVMVGTFALAPLMKVNFLGDSGGNTMTMTQNLGPSASLEAKDKAAAKVEEAIKDVDGIRTVQVSVGSSGSPLGDAFSGGAGVTYSITTDDGADQETIREDLRAATEDLTDVGEISLSAAAGFGSSDIEISVTAPDQADLEDATSTLVDAFTGKDGITQVTSNLAASLPYIGVVVDRDRAAAAGLSEIAIGGIVANTMRPEQVGSVELDSTAVSMFLQVKDAPATIEELKDLQIPTAAGMARLSDFAKVEQTTGPASVTTEQGQRTATVSITPEGDDLISASATVTEVLDSVELPQGANASLGGVVDQQESAFSSLGLAMLIALLVIYIIMVATFKSLRQPLLLLISVPFAATGGILLQVVTGVPLGVASLVGVLMLIGIVVTNAIVLVDLVNQYRRKGLSMHEATLAGSSMRLRPILMTALATIFALIPMAIGITGHGGFISQPLAIVVIGGLLSSTVLTLLVLPTLFNLVEAAKERRAARKAAKRGEEPASESASVTESASGAAVAADAGERTETVGTDTQAHMLTRRQLRELQEQEAEPEQEAAAQEPWPREPKSEA